MQFETDRQGDATKRGSHNERWARGGQTMVEYALIIAAIAVVAWSAYAVTGRDIGSMASGIDSSLTSA